MCGGYCLVASLYAFELVPIRKPIKLNKIDKETLSFTGPPVVLEEGDDLYLLMKKLYSLIGIISLEKHSCYISSIPGLSSPVAAAYICRELGLDVKILFRDEARMEALRLQFPQEFRLNEKIQVPMGYALAENRIGANEVIMTPVKNRDNNYHSIVLGPEGQIYDPLHFDRKERLVGRERAWNSSLEVKSDIDWLGVALKVTLP